MRIFQDLRDNNAECVRLLRGRAYSKKRDIPRVTRAPHLPGVYLSKLGTNSRKLCTGTGSSIGRDSRLLFTFGFTATISSKKKRSIDQLTTNSATMKQAGVGSRDQLGGVTVPRCPEKLHRLVGGGALPGRGAPIAYRTRTLHGGLAWTVKDTWRLLFI